MTASRLAARAAVIEGLTTPTEILPLFGGSAAAEAAA